jgi:rare lipoprotein A
MVAYLSAGWQDAARALTARVVPSGFPRQGRAAWPDGAVWRLAAAAVCGLATANCSTPTQKFAGPRTREVDPKYGVAPSPRLYGENDVIPKGGGRNFTGRPYVVAGKTYTPREDPRGYVREGLASWYGTAFHGRQTANGEVFDRFSVAAAHPTLPLPSYARVTNLANGHSMIVRVNDRGPYHENRVMDVSQRVAEALEFRRAGTTRVRIEYVGKASLAGSDDTKLMATLRTDGRSAPLPGQRSIMFADAGADTAPAPRPALVAMAAARAAEAPEDEPFRPVAPRPVEPARAAEPARPALAFRPASPTPEPRHPVVLAQAPAKPEPAGRVAAHLPAAVRAVAPSAKLAALAPPPRTASAMSPAGARSPAPKLAATPMPVLRAAARPSRTAEAEARPPLRLTAPPLQLARAMPAPPERPAAKPVAGAQAGAHGKAVGAPARVQASKPTPRAKVAEAR